jgi:hypothetical protein
MILSEQALNQAEVLLQEDFPAKTSALLAKELVLLAHEAGYSGTLQELWKKRKQNTSSSKTYLVCFPVTTEKILESSSGRWPTSGILSAGACLMLNTSAYPSEGSVSSSLDAVLLDQAPEKYSLSPTACEGILRRSAGRGKKLPDELHEALVNQVSQGTQKDQQP